MQDNYQEKTVMLLQKISTDPSNRILYRNQIVELNMRLVNHVLKKYKPYSEDQFQAGSIGLILAVNTFKEDKNVPFHSYACFCIEREIHKLHRHDSTLFENVMGENMTYLNALIKDRKGESETTIEDLIPDIVAEEDFEKVVAENDLKQLFDQIVHPAINKIAGNNRGQTVQIDIADWKKLESRYILEMATSNESQKTRFNLSQMARKLKMSIQNTRTRHVKVLKDIQEKCIQKGYKRHE